jgi:streptogramin lyase
MLHADRNGLSRARGKSGRRPSPHCRLSLEPLEGRCLPATFTPFPLPANVQPPANIAKGPDGNLWFTVPTTFGFNSPAGSIGKMTTSGSFTLYPLPSGSTISSADQITAGPDGNVWFSEGAAKIAKISPSGQIQEFALPNNFFTVSAITAGPDGNVWYTRPGFGVGKVTPAGQITEFPIPSLGGGGFGGGEQGSMTKGGDGNLWLSTISGIGKFTVTGSFTPYPINSSGFDFHRVHSIALGPDHNVWFTETVTQGGLGGSGTDLDIGRITPTGQITEYPLITGFGNSASLGGLAAGQDDKLYFTENNQIGVVTPSSNGPPTFVQIPNPNAGSVSAYYEDIAAGPDGKLYYTQQSFAAIVKLDVNGTSPVVLQSIIMTPANPTVAVGLTERFVATGHYSDSSIRDLTSSVTWASSNTNVAPISGAGVATAQNVGTSTIRATLGGVVGSTMITVSPAALVSITVTPANSTLARGRTRQLIAKGTYTDKTTKILTTAVAWSSSSSGVATVSNKAGSKGLVKGVGKGKATIRAILGRVVGSTGLNVS